MVRRIARGAHVKEAALFTQLALLALKPVADPELALFERHLVDAIAFAITFLAFTFAFPFALYLWATTSKPRIAARGFCQSASWP